MFLLLFEYLVTFDWMPDSENLPCCLLGLLYFYYYSWTLRWDATEFLGESLILYDLTLKLCLLELEVCSVFCGPSPVNHDVFPVWLIRTGTSYACPGVSTGHCWPLLSFGMALSPAVVSSFAYTHRLVFSWILEGGHLQSSLSTCVAFSSPGLSLTHHGCRDGPDSLLSLLNWRSRLQSAYFTASWPGTSLQAESWDDQRSYLICFSSLRSYCLSLPHSSVLQIVYFGREGESGPRYSIVARCRHYPSF